MQTQRIQFGRNSADEADKLIWGDNVTVLASTRDASVDLVYMDPPFGTGTTRRGGQRDDSPLRHSFRDVPRDPDAYVAWLRECLMQSHRVLAHHGSIFVHLDYRTVHYVKVELDRIFGHNRFVNEIVWCYSVGGRSRRMFGRKHDSILWYARTADYAFFPEAVRVPRKPGSHMRVVQTEDGELVQEKTDRKSGKVYRYPLSAGKVPEDWWTDIEVLNRGDAERTGWPTQKPERLLERIIKGASSKGALIADWFCGSATTGVVAQRYDRRFLMVDTEWDAIECASARLQASGQAMADAGRPPRDIELHRLLKQTQVTLRM